MVYDRGLKLAISYDDGKQEAEPTGSNVCAIDPGEIHSIAAVVTSGQSLIVTGRKLRSMKLCIKQPSSS
ncbi:hypothetical protein PP175_06915 [Aneurinibacillus sp. Ricciae_BoGa-3]|uniref:hypothetical protein n=1 Tax=Aneurinibacillus sp. Ricciae_BoGa-3 TaxID=3022697 RepID=UPI00233FB699|nr:hypothetical protein [Aneurinibacillus sp. Ricciae_BoGa-3]WCK55666.1 hypothetical protein PP175_06915 [Aneurinibacillus sp. Ricciae_BoGa-3]